MGIEDRIYTGLKHLIPGTDRHLFVLWELKTGFIRD